MARYERLGDELAQRIVAGGYPAALARGTITFHHFRDRDDYEVDIVLEQGIRALASWATCCRSGRVAKP